MIFKIKTRPAYYILGAVFLSIIFLFLRLWRLGSHDLWYDEIATFHYAAVPWPSWNAPFYPIILHFWIKISGVSEFALRFPSALFSFFTVPLVFLLGRSLFNRKIALLASLIIGLSPFHLWYAQEARDYSTVLFFGTLSSYLLVLATQKNNNKLWLGFIFVSFCGIFTDYFYILLFVSQFIAFFILKKFKFDFLAVISFFFVALGFSFYLPFFLSKFIFVQGGFWVPKPEWAVLGTTLENFILGYNGSAFLYAACSLLIAISAIYLITVIFQKKVFKDNFLFCLIVFFIPIVSAFFISKIFFSVYLDRGLILFSPYFYLIFSLGILSTGKNVKIILLVILSTLLFICDLRYFNDQMFIPLEHHLGTYIKKPIRALANFLKDNAGAEDIIAFTNSSTSPSLEFYGRGVKMEHFYYFFDPKLLDTNWQRPIEESDDTIPFYKVKNLKFKRLWVLSSDWARSGALDENSQIVMEWLNQNIKLIFRREFDGLWISVYEKYPVCSKE